MKNIIIFTAQYLLCFLSVLLTCLFAYQFSSEPSVFAIQSVLMIGVGVCIDVCKYVFWYFREYHRAVYMLSMVLVFFSWGASLSFFVTLEKNNIEKARKDTDAYAAHEIHIASLKKQISDMELLASKRLNSKFHAQWQAAEESIKNLSKLRLDLKTAIHERVTVGREEAQTQSTSSLLFLVMSEALQLSVGVVTLLAFGVLSILIESCALGLIFLSQKQVSKPMEIGREVDLSTKELLKRDLLNNDVLLQVTEIMKKYKLSHPAAKNLLNQLTEEGFLFKVGKQFFLKNRSDN